MLPGIGGGEIVVIAVVALVVVGPKDLPKLLRQLGRFVGRMRAMADDFRTSFEDMARQSELDDLRKEVEALRNSQSLPGIADMKTEMTSIESDIHQSLNAVPVQPVSVEPLEAPVETAHTDSKVADPQLEGLPPRRALDEGAKTPLKKPQPPRAKKAPAITSASSDETAPVKPKRTRAPKAKAETTDSAS
ncbi:Sec-independent protein translocase protein TatB [Asticcacaulis solisilvae]|uniref:Sec-independent protein translocase protein TatB n=1 Tax=Asticcacaulis solisilvae TaxID=1217274 RepID=UPI003FD82DAD